MDWYPWYYERFRLKTRHLTAEQEGIYRRLIDEYMATRQPLPDNELALSGIARVTPDCFASASSTVLAFFKQKRGGFLSHQTCDELLAEQDRVSKFRTDRAKRGAKARHEKSNEINAIPASSKQQALLKPATVTVTVTSKVPKDTPLPPTIPEWLPRGAWDDFVSFRKGTKFSPKAQQLAITTLDELRQSGNDPTAVINQSILNNWKGLFPLKGNHNGQTSRHAGTASSSGGIVTTDGGTAGGAGYGGRKSQTQLASEITEQIKRDRRAQWEADNPGKPYC